MAVMKQVVTLLETAEQQRRDTLQRMNGDLKERNSQYNMWHLAHLDGYIKGIKATVSQRMADKGDEMLRIGKRISSETKETKKWLKKV